MFQDSKGVWHFRTEIESNPATGERRIVETKGKVKADARQRHEAKLDEYRRSGIIRSSKSPYLKDYAERWHASRRTRIKPNTWYSEGTHLHVIYSIIGGVRLTGLDPAHIRLLVDTLSETRMPRTVTDYWMLVRSLLNDAVLEGLIDRNPCDRVRAPRNDTRPREILDPAQVRLLLDTVRTHRLVGRDDGVGPCDSDEDSHMWALMFELAFATGMREGERYAITPSSLQIREGVPGIMVTRQLQRYYGDVRIPKWHDAKHVQGMTWMVPPKSSAGVRFVPVSWDLWRRLWDRIVAYGMTCDQLVFTNLRGDPLCMETERRRWVRALELAGLPRVSVHTARHWTATMLAESGASADERMRILGHSSLKMTAVYTHWGARALGEAMSRAIPDLGA